MPAATFCFSIEPIWLPVNHGYTQYAGKKQAAILKCFSSKQIFPSFRRKCLCIHTYIYRESIILLVLTCSISVQILTLVARIRATKNMQGRFCLRKGREVAALLVFFLPHYAIAYAYVCISLAPLEYVPLRVSVRVCSFSPVEPAANNLG